MGPAFSIITTVLFLALSAQSKDPLLRNLVIMSAILNGFNLLPIIPLDGGNITRALLSRYDPGVTKVFQFAGLCAGGTIAVFTGDYVLLAIFSLVATSILRITPATNAQTLAPIDRQAGFLLLTAYLATALFYIAVIARFTWKT